jgi:diaminohydroxyphosphoribosylaminopyrimidine deaminase/5-amino-6-(5-phosphoribosylamino)uracil reductase
MENDSLFMRRALDLAQLGTGYARPNPLVGCVVTHEGRIIGEGWHRQYGGPHAEVNALASVENQELLRHSRVYVTLEPCAHHGKTPPCADLLIAKGVPEVVICNDDPFPLVAGRGLEKLRAAGVQVETGLLAAEGRWLNRRFFTFHEKKRPYLVLKWAETADGFLAGRYYQSVQISSPQAGLLTHQWRAEEAAILVGTRTALHDNPRLNVRDWPGPQPLRVVIDKNLSLPPSHHVLDHSQPTRLYTYRERANAENLTYLTLTEADNLLPQVLADLWEQQVQSVLVEGGPTVLNALINAGLWDEIRIFKSPNRLAQGIAAPRIGLNGLRERTTVGPDTLYWYVNN